MRKTLSAFFVGALLAVLLASTPPASSRQTSSRYSLGPVSVTFSQLGALPNGQQRWCSNCQATAPCTSGGSGAFASRVAGAWNCFNGSGGSSNPFTDSTALVKGSADATKLFRIEADGITTGTTVVATPPTTSFTMARTDAAQTFAGVQTYANGTKTTPTIVFANQGASGFYSRSSGVIGYGVAGTLYFEFTGSGPQLKSDTDMCWSSGEPDSAGCDTAIGRSAAGMAEVTNSVSGTFRDLKLRGLQHATGTRPTCDATNRGMTWYVAGGAGVADTYELCRKDSADAYAWVALF